jgi:hypothetical protein
MQQLSIDMHAACAKEGDGWKKRKIALFKEGMRLCHPSPVFSAPRNEDHLGSASDASKSLPLLVKRCLKLFLWTPLTNSDETKFQRTR